MNGFPTIGALYSFHASKLDPDKSLLFVVVENNANDDTTTLLVVDEGPQNGKKIVTSARKVYETEPLGPVFTPNGEIVIENGREYIKVSKTKKLNFE